MDGDEAPLAEYAALCRTHGAALIVDEAHAVGIYGARGSGLIEARGVPDDVFVSINTAGKALGVSGAFVAGAAVAIEYLVQQARPFIFSTAPPPAVAAALEASLAVIAEEPERRERLLARSGYLRAGRRGRRTVGSSSQIIPIVIGENQRATAVARELQRAGFDVRAIRPPSVPPGTARLRVSLNEGLSEGHARSSSRMLSTALKDHDPRPLRNRHRYQHRQDRRGGGADVPVPPSAGTPVLETHPDRRRALTTTPRSTASRLPAGPHEILTRACGCRGRCRRTWRRG